MSRSEVLVFSERNELTYELLSGGREIARQLGHTISAAILGPEAKQRSRGCLPFGAERIYVCEDSLLSTFEVEAYAEALNQIAQKNGVRILLVGSTRRGKELAGRVAQKLGAGCITDAIGLELVHEELVARRYALGGNTISSEVLRSETMVISVMPKAFEAKPLDALRAEIVEVPASLREPRVRFVERREKKGEAVDIERAEILIAVGKGLRQKEDLALIRQLATTLKAEIGCTRALASDYHWLSEDRMIGISGKKCRPRLHISIGASGQIQHAVGIMDSKLIVAINKDKEAPIFRLADYGIVGDLYEVVPMLWQRIRDLSKPQS